jgi:hypothetical protein
MSFRNLQLSFWLSCCAMRGVSMSSKSPKTCIWPHLHPLYGILNPGLCVNTSPITKLFATRADSNWAPGDLDYFLERNERRDTTMKYT